MCLIFFISNDNIVTEKIPKETLQMAKTNTKIIGKEHYINASTGELMEMDVIESIEKDVDSNFYKLFMKDFLYAMDIVSNQKSKVAYWIIDHLQKVEVCHILRFFIFHVLSPFVYFSSQCDSILAYYVCNCK